MSQNQTMTACGNCPRTKNMKSEDQENDDSELIREHQKLINLYQRLLKNDGRQCLRGDGSIYLSGGMCIFPDGGVEFE